MPDTARQNTYKKKKDSISYNNPLYNTSAIIKGVGDKYKQATSKKKKN